MLSPGHSLRNPDYLKAVVARLLFSPSILKLCIPDLSPKN
jgi:hypothetical protein